MTRPPPTSTPFPYTTLFRSHDAHRARDSRAARAARRCAAVDRHGAARRARRSRSGHAAASRSEEHTSELQSLAYLVCRLLLEKKKLRPLLPHFGARPDHALG